MQKARFILVHGWGATSTSDWLPWLKQQLEKSGCTVIAPDMPNTDEPVIADWVKALAEATGTVDENTYFVGHSIGCQTILRYLETVAGRCGGVLLVAPWLALSGLSEEEMAIAQPWLETPINTSALADKMDKKVALYSTNDPYVPVENADRFREHFGFETLSLGERGHVNAEDGVTELPEALEVLTRWM